MAYRIKLRVALMVSLLAIGLNVVFVITAVD